MTPSLEDKTQNLIPCCYVNGSSRSKIVRIPHDYNPYLEKVVLPGTKLYFQAQPQAFLEIHSNDIISAILEDRIACSYLQI